MSSPHPAVLAWRGPSLLVTSPGGECGPEQPSSGFFHRETRFLSELRFELDGRRAWACDVATPDPSEIALSLVYPEPTRFSGGGSDTAQAHGPVEAGRIPDRALELWLRMRVLPGLLEVSLEATNRALQPIGFELAWALDADFRDLLEASLPQPQWAPRVEPLLVDGALELCCADDRLPFRTRVMATRQSGEEGAAVEALAPPAGSRRLSTRVSLASQGRCVLRLRIEALDPGAALDDSDRSERALALARWRGSFATIEARGDGDVGRIIRHSLDDLASLPLLEGERDEWLALQAGVPLYPALFGRDGLTAAWQMAMVDRGRGLDDALTRLGRLQGERVDPERDEEPGRIVQQVRAGPLARLGANPFGRYYGDFASPLMFVISLAHLYAWTGDRAQLARHWDAARRALDWARDYGDRDGDGYLEYLTASPHGPQNQGWKDSGDGIPDEQGRAVPSPAATCELQGYWFAAQQLMAMLSRVMGHRADADAHWRSAMDLKARFNRDWWLDDEGYVALALDPSKRPVRTVASNGGHCLASGIVSDEHVPALVGRLFAPDLFSGWGIRTLSSRHPSYHPLSYHLGSVWAVEGATTAFGLRRYGYDVRAAELARGLFDLAALHDGERIPEAVGGHARGERSRPGTYPRANAPQAWNLSAVPLLVHTLLGLQPVAPLDLLVVDPALPAWLPEVVVRDLRLGGATATLRFWRDADGASHAEVLRKRGTLHLVRQPPPESLRAGVSDRARALLDGLIHG